MNNLRENEQRAKIAILFIWIVFALEIISFISSYLQYNLFEAMESGKLVSDEAINASNSRESVVGILYGVASLFSAITFIMWFRRAYYNLHQKVENLSYSEGWAAGSWFVPVVNWFRPYQIMKELYTETKRLLTKKGLAESVNYTTTNLGWWWTFWIITGIFGSIIFQISFRYTETIEDNIVLSVLYMVSNVLNIPLTFITVKVIKDYSKVEPLLHEISEESEDFIQE